VDCCPHLASRYQLVEQTGQLDVIDRRHLVYIIRPVVWLTEPRRRQPGPEVVKVQSPPGSTVCDSSGRSRTAGVDWPMQQMMVRQADVEDIDSFWTARVGSCDHSVKRAAELVRGARVVHDLILKQNNPAKFLPDPIWNGEGFLKSIGPTTRRRVVIWHRGSCWSKNRCLTARTSRISLTDCFFSAWHSILKKTAKVKYWVVFTSTWNKIDWGQQNR